MMHASVRSRARRRPGSGTVVATTAAKTARQERHWRAWVQRLGVVNLMVVVIIAAAAVVVMTTITRTSVNPWETAAATQGRRGGGFGIFVHAAEVEVDVQGETASAAAEDQGQPEPQQQQQQQQETFIAEETGSMDPQAMVVPEAAAATTTTTEETIAIATTEEKNQAEDVEKTLENDSQSQTQTTIVQNPEEPTEEKQASVEAVADTVETQQEQQQQTPPPPEEGVQETISKETVAAAAVVVAEDADETVETPPPPREKEAREEQSMTRTANRRNRNRRTLQKESVEPPPPDDGVDISWPMHYSHYSHITRKDSPYSRYMKQCQKQYSAYDCQSYERDRLVMNRVQPPACINFTAAGFAKVPAPAEALSILQQFWFRYKDTKHLKREVWDEGNTYTNHWVAPSYVLDIYGGDNGKGPRLKSEDYKVVLNQVQYLLERWTNTSLQDTSVYGIRSYTTNSILAPHVDRFPLIVSAILHVDHDSEEPWILQVIQHNGKAVNVTMEPGDMVLYESHSVIHGRPYPFQGRYYANIFFHFEPIGYTAELTQKLKEASESPSHELYKTAQAMFEEELLSDEEDEEEEEEEEDYDDEEEEEEYDEEDNAAAHEKPRGPRRQQPSTQLPPYLSENDPAVPQWRQQYAFYRQPEPTVPTDPKVTGKSSSSAAKKVPRTEGVTDAHLVAASGDLKQLKLLAARNPQALHEADANGWKPIHEAARTGRTTILEFLIEQGADVNERTNDGEGGSPLWWAEHALPHDHAVVELLRRHGAVAVAPFE